MRLIIIILLIISGGFLLGRQRSAPVPPSLPLPAPQLKTFGQYRYAIFTAADISRLKLVSNLPGKQDSLELKNQHRCHTLINAGFYDEKDQHLGWFVAEGKEISPAQTNRLFNGFLTSKHDQISLGFEKPGSVDWGLQSGPVLVYDGKPLKLTIKDDQPRRRVAAAITRNKQLYFLTILSSQSDYAGPLLAETPKLLLGINPEIVSAINLDGGSASAFLSDAVFLPEHSPIGGFFCYTKP